MPPYFLTLRLPYVLLGTDAASDPDRVLEPQLTHEKKARVFYEMDSQIVAKTLLELFRCSKPSPGIPGDPAKPVGSSEEMPKLVEGICQPFFELLDGAELDLPRRVLYRGDLKLLKMIAACGEDPGVREAVGLPNDRRTVLLWEHYERARQWEPLVRNELGVDKSAQEGPAGAMREAVYLWFTWGKVITSNPHDDRSDKCYFHKTDSKNVANHLCTMFQESQGKKLWFGCTPANELAMGQTILADDFIRKYQDGKVVGIDADFSSQATHWEKQLREKLGFGPNQSPATGKAATKADPMSRAMFDLLNRLPLHSGTVDTAPLDWAILDFLAKLSVDWETVDIAALTATKQQALKLLTRAGLVEERIRVRVSMDGFPQRVNMQFCVSGDYASSELVKKALCAVPEWIDAKGRTRGRYTLESDGAVEMRLTDQGEQAKHDYDSKSPGKPSFILAFVRGIGSTGIPRPGVAGTMKVEYCRVTTAQEGDKPGQGAMPATAQAKAAPGVAQVAEQVPVGQAPSAGEPAGKEVANTVPQEQPLAGSKQVSWNPNDKDYIPAKDAVAYVREINQDFAYRDLNKVLTGDSPMRHMRNSNKEEKGPGSVRCKVHKGDLETWCDGLRRAAIAKARPGGGKSAKPTHSNEELYENGFAEGRQEGYHEGYTEVKERKGYSCEPSFQDDPTDPYVHGHYEGWKAGCKEGRWDSKNGKPQKHGARE